MKVNHEKIVESVKAILEAVGEDPKRKGLIRTPQRIAEMYEEIFAGLHKDPKKELKVSIQEDHDEIVLVKDIYFASMCEHHFLPFTGKAHVGYIPKGNRVIGLNTLVHAVDLFAKKPQLQERLTTNIADALMEVLKPQGVIVLIEAEHLCMTMRGVKKHGAIAVTSAVRGIFRKNSKTRAEALSLIKSN